MLEMNIYIFINMTDLLETMAFEADQLQKLFIRFTGIARDAASSGVAIDPQTLLFFT